MADLIVSLNKNQLKLSFNSDAGFEGRVFDVPSELVNDSRIIDPENFSAFCKNAINEFSTPGVKKSQLVFLVEPSEVYLRFVVVDKNTEDIDATILEHTKEKLESFGISLEDLYFSYQKIAPFVYQFVAIKKTDLDLYLNLSGSLGLSLKAIVPWVLLLPKFLISNDPCVFIIKTSSRNVVALAELNGIYYCEDFAEEKSNEEIQELVEQLSVYKRNDPIQKIYTITDSSLGFDPESFDVNPLLGLIGENGEAAGYEAHLLTEYLLDKNPDYTTGQVNLLNFLPMPVVEKKATSLVLVGASAAVLLLLGGFLYFRNGNSSESPSLELASNSDGDSPVVLGEENIPAQENNQQNEDLEPQEALNREDISIRVENGAGIPGIASQTQSFLENLGYSVASIGNAAETGRETTLVQIKASSSKYLDMLQEDLSEEYDVETQEDLPEDTEYDVLVVVGTN